MELVGRPKRREREEETEVVAVVAEARAADPYLPLSIPRYAENVCSIDSLRRRSEHCVVVRRRRK